MLIAGTVKKLAQQVKFLPNSVQRLIQLITHNRRSHNNTYETCELGKTMAQRITGTRIVQRCTYDEDHQIQRIERVYRFERMTEKAYLELKIRNISQRRSKETHKSIAHHNKTRHRKQLQRRIEGTECSENYWNAALQPASMQRGGASKQRVLEEEILQDK